MKFILSILALLAIVFLVGCSAKDTRDNKLSNSEITKLGKKYGGVYVFNKKFEKEIDDRERERKEAIKELKGRDLGGGLYAVDTKSVDQKFPQTLSNGKKYYTDTADYGREYNKRPKIPKEYKEKIINLIGHESWNKCIPVLNPEYFYVTDSGEIAPITIGVIYKFQTTKFGFFGDEGRGFSLSRERFEYYEVKNKFYMEDLEK